MSGLFSHYATHLQLLSLHRNKDSLLSQAAATRSSMTRAVASSAKESAPVSSTNSDSAGIADAIAAGTVTTTASPAAAKKPNTIVVSMSTAAIPLEVNSLFVHAHMLSSNSICIHCIHNSL